MTNLICRCALLSTVLIVCANADAQSSLVAQATGPGAFSLHSGTTPQTASVSGTWTPPADPIFAYSGYASAIGYGALNSSSNNLQMGGWSTTLGTRTSATAAWFDDMVVNPANPLLLGTPGTLTATIRVTGNVSAGYSGLNEWIETSDDVPTASAAMSVYLNGGFHAFTNDYVQARGTEQSVSQSINRVETITIPFVFGQWFNLGVNIATLSSIETLSPQPTVPSASSSAYANCEWGGVTSVSSTDGLLQLGDFALLSASGTNYMDSILAPSPSAAAALALTGLSLARRRR